MVKSHQWKETFLISIIYIQNKNGTDLSNLCCSCVRICQRKARLKEKSYKTKGKAGEY